MKRIEIKNKIISYLLLSVLIYPSLALSNGPTEPSSGFSFDIVTNFFRNLGTNFQNNVQDRQHGVNGVENSHGNPEISQIILETNSMTSGISNIRMQPFTSVSGFSAMTDCPPRQGPSLFGSLDSMQLCSKQDIYREAYIDQVTTQTNRVADNYVLQLDPENINKYCQCVRSRPTRYNINGPSNSIENMKKRTEVINNLLKTGIQRLAARFNELSPKVMYALTSSEMASLHMSEKLVKNEEGVSRNLVQKSALNACAPGQFDSLLYQMLKDEGSTNQLCTKEGARRLGIGFVHGRGHDCRGPRANSPHCQGNSSYGLMLQKEITADESVRAIGRYVSRSGDRQLSDVYLNRHHNQLLERNKNLNQSDIVRVLSREEMGPRRKGSGHQNDFSEHIQDAVWNEMSKDGQQLWMENNGPILRALELYSKNNVIHDDQITGSLEHFKSQVILNPYLAKYFPNIQTDDDGKIKEAIISYVKNELKDKLAMVTNSKNRDANKDIGLDDINAAMFLTYAEDYEKVVKECEDIQKTLISLCQAATNYGPRIEQVSDFFVNPLLVKLFNEDQLKIYRGSDTATTDDLVSASGMFCQDLNPSDVISTANDQARMIHQKLADAPFLSGVRNLRQFLGNIGKGDDWNWDNSSRNYLAAETGARNAQRVSHEGLANNDMKTIVTVTTAVDSHAVIVPASYSSPEQREEAKKRNEGSPVGVVSDISTQTELKKISSGELGEMTTASTGPVKDLTKESNRSDTLFKPDGNGMDSVQPSFMDNFTTGQLNQNLNNIEVDQAKPTELTEQTQAQVDPIQAELLAQLERMRAREEEMARQIAELKQNMEDEKDERRAEQYEREQKALKDRVESLTAQLNERKAEVQKAAITPAQSFTGGLGGITGSRATSSAPRVQPTVSAAAQNTAVAPASSPAAQAPRAAQNSMNSSNNLASGNGFGLIASQAGQSTAVRGGQRLQAVTIAAGETNLAAIARSVDGNTALRQTSDPDVLEKIIFKEVDGEIVFVNGQPVIERTELLTLEEAQMLEENEALAMEAESANERAPASIEEQMEEIEQSLYPRSRVYSADELADEINRGRRMQD